MKNLLKIARPQFLVSGIALGGFGLMWGLLLGAEFDLGKTILGFLIMATAQLSVSYSNDYFDVEVDKFNPPTPYSGGSGVLVENPNLILASRRIAIALIATSLTLGVLYQVLLSFSWVFSFVVIASNWLGWVYTAPPLKLVYRGFGELALVLLIGFLIPGFGYLVAKGSLGLEGLVFTIPQMLYGLAFILSVQIPDMEADRLLGKRNWISRWGRKFGFYAIAASFILATTYFFCLDLFSNQLLPVDVAMFTKMSLIPLAAGIFVLANLSTERKKAIHLVGIILGSLAILTIGMDVYLASVLSGRDWR